MFHHIPEPFTDPLFLLADTMYPWTFSMGSTLTHPVHCTWQVFYKYFININYLSKKKEETWEEEVVNMEGPSHAPVHDYHWNVTKEVREGHRLPARWLNSSSQTTCTRLSHTNCSSHWVSKGNRIQWSVQHQSIPQRTSSPCGIHNLAKMWALITWEHQPYSCHPESMFHESRDKSLGMRTCFSLKFPLGVDPLDKKER